MTTPFKDFLASLEHQREKVKKRVAAILMLCEGAKAVELVGEENPDKWLIVSPSLLTAGGYRVTYGDELGPVGHEEFTSMEIALRACGGESFTDKVHGPPHFAWHPYRVVKTNKVDS